MIHSKFRQHIIIGFFIAALSFPLINNKLKVISDSENTENRQLSALPEVDLRHLDRYPELFDKYYNDHFSLRYKLIKHYNEINIDYFHKSTSGVIIGKEGWLYMKANELKTYKGLEKFSSKELECLKKELEYRKDYLNARGIKFYILIAPSKCNVYDNMMPSTIYRYDKEPWVEQISTYLTRHSRVKPVNVYPILKKERNNLLTYYKLDNHWNNVGAFYAVNEFVRRLELDSVNIKPLSITDVNIQKEVIHGGNLACMFSNYKGFTDTVYTITPKGGLQSKDVPKVGYPPVPGFAYPDEFEIDREIPGSTKPRLLIISDSFGGSFFTVASEYFGRTVKIFDAWQYKLNESIIEKEKPDVVLLMLLESNARGILQYASNPEARITN